MASEQINKDRLNELLGIQPGQSIEDYLNDGTSMDDADAVISKTQAMLAETKNEVQSLDDKFEQQIEVIDNGLDELHTDVMNMATSTSMKDADGSAATRINNLVNVEGAFKSIEDLVDTTKSMIGNVYGIISSCDVLDSETVSAAASLIGETRQLLAEYTSLYKQRVKFFDNVKMEMLKQKNKIELLERKYQLDREKEEWKMKNQTQTAQAEVVEGQSVPSGMISTGTVDMLKLLEDMDDDSEEDDE